MLRDICRTGNTYFPNLEVATETARGLVCDGWKGLQRWLRGFELRGIGKEPKVRIELGPGVAKGEARAILLTLENRL